MSNQSEDNLLDQSLRDVFRDYDLPPDAHPRVWEGVAARVAMLPAPSTGFPYRFLLLPFTAAVGIGLGWLLPHPAAQQVPGTTVPTVYAASYVPAVATEPVATATLPLADATAITTQPATQSAARPRQVPRKRQVAARIQPTRAVQTVVPAALDSVGLAAVQAAVTPEVVVPTDNAPTVALPVPAAPLQPVASSQASAQPQQFAPTAKAAKHTGTNEKIGYRKLSQRQPEGRRGVGRWFTRLFQGVRHLLS